MEKKTNKKETKKQKQGITKEEFYKILDKASQPIKKDKSDLEKSKT